MDKVRMLYVPSAEQLAGLRDQILAL